MLLKSFKFLKSCLKTVLLFFLLTGISYSQENLPVKDTVPEIPVLKGGLNSVLLGGLEEDEDMVQEGLTGNFSLGAAGAVLSNQSSKFMEYGGKDNSSGYFHGNADLSYHQDSYFANFWAEDLGLDNRNLSLEIGRYENYKFSASFSQIPHLLSDNSKTPLEGLGGSNFTLPTGFVTGANASAITVTGVKDSDLAIDERNTTAFGFSKNVGKNTYSLSYRNQTKDGSKSLGAVVGTNAGNARSIVLPETFDQTSNEISAAFMRVEDNRQFKFEYFLSLFDNKIESVSFESPYSGTIGTGVTAPSSGLISRAPDNTHHRLSASGRWDISETSRVSVVTEYGLMLQDEDLFAFSVGTSRDLLPRQSAQAKMHTLHFNIDGSFRPSKNLNLKARFRHYQTINDTPSTLFLAVVNDTEGQVTENNTRALISQPYDIIQDELKFDASYKLFKATHAKLGYGVERMERSSRAVEESWKNTYKGGIRSNYFSNTSINLKASFAKKIGKEYDSFSRFAERHTTAFVTNSGFDSLPDLRRLDISNRDRMKWGTNITWFLSDLYTFGINFQYQEDDYPDSLFGLKYQRNQNITLDANYSPSDTISYFIFYTISQMDAEQNGREFFNTASATDADRDWRVDHDDNTHTVGLGSRASFLENRLTLKADYTFTQSISNITFAAGSNSAVANPVDMPNLGSVRHSFETTGEYKINENLSWGISYLYENYKEDDFATDGIDPGTAIDFSTSSSVILLSGSNQDYNGHLFMVFASYQIGK